ncbi:MAG: hypothetical protein A2350_15935 [Candidatus Raymondbacteria bacterium RifOxyB12_full_50_8]|uniref:Fibronectin type-III domain-containing protein n=1 Tax=Candidatus Raymondbacteria bacterium RIFOXYD12_FULL_49_13 TaxID=1817890 RepID=A0A1F7F772_UNCRA|nr:MAG: hypothetical protein A2248_00210 [Candidatus Raymondbacteria bacterium RIFOXYA2_FULL_49_16]OGJ96167.1 MAG: hypothetical protein A2453_05560 [Candidatus Raymondbacteria bacterium RIFOXYC2_FULL_50_21]OGK02422.1 MAG: hypothetical protein A2519_14485 [Candidatus Raymondbacteria bacterium RIFOXYD12_FULL_49_13]OGK03541.1 MAG: hypothetical protein A2350_15935 [Candidatus Raymondbacteria bacterium RifOxyB12_full_50_8]OGP41280.1 MAG: hypothetical protein A2324_16800 [Candidatus Raymondbacteria b
MKNCQVVVIVVLLLAVGVIHGAVLKGATNTNIDVYCAEFTQEIIDNLRSLHAHWKTNPGWNTYRVTTFGNSITIDGKHWTPLAQDVIGNANAADINAFKDSTFNQGRWIADGKVAESGRTIKWVANQVQYGLSTQKPMIAAIMIGTNNVSINSSPAPGCSTTLDCAADTFEYKQITGQLIARGVIPIMTTIPPVQWETADLFRKPLLDAYNDKLRRFASSHRFPLIDLNRWCEDHGPLSSLLGDWAHPVGCSDGDRSFSDNCLDGGSSGGVQNARNYMLVMAIDDIVRYVVDEEAFTPEAVPPAAVANLAAQPEFKSGAVLLTWTAPGDDGTSGLYAESYDIRYSTSLITESTFFSAVSVDTALYPKVPGTQETLSLSGLPAGQTLYFALKTSDETHNASGISNVTVASTGIKVSPVADTYLDRGDQTSNGTDRVLQLKSDDRGVICFKFDLSAVTGVPDSAVIVMKPRWGDLPFNYTAAVRPILVDWDEAIAWQGTMLSDNIGAGAVYPSTSYSGSRFGQQEYYFPVPKAAIQAYAAGIAKGLALVQTAADTNTNDFFSREASASSRPFMMVFGGGATPVEAVRENVSFFDVNISPNPFNPVAIIEIIAPMADMHEIHIAIYNVNGKMVKKYNTTDTRIVWNVSSLPSGAYFIQARAGISVVAKRVVLLK